MPVNKRAVARKRAASKSPARLAAAVAAPRKPKTVFKEIPATSTATPAAVEMVIAPVVAEASPVEVTQPAPESAAVLIAQLQASDADLAVDAAAELGKLDTAEGRAALTAVLANAEGFYHTVTRAAAALALGQSADPTVAADLHLAAQDDDAEVSREAILSLGRVKATASIPLLMRIAENPTGFYAKSARYAAVRALGMIPAMEARDLLAYFTMSEDRAIAAAADEALRGM